MAEMHGRRIPLLITAMSTIEPDPESESRDILTTIRKVYVS